MVLIMVICPDCGKEVTDAKFCSNCGANLKPPAEDIVPAAVEVPEDVIDVDVKKENESAGTAENVKKSKFCSQCGEEVELETVFCPKCGNRFEQKRAEPQTKFCQSCGEKISINAEICPHCGVRVANIRVTEEKNVLLSAILSFLFPGLGHLYLGLNTKGVSFIIAYIISIILIFLIIGLVLVIIVWIWALIDSIKSTEAINRGEFVEDKLF